MTQMITSLELCEKIMYLVIWDSNDEFMTESQYKIKELQERALKIRDRL